MKVLSLMLLSLLLFACDKPSPESSTTSASTTQEAPQQPTKAPQQPATESATAEYSVGIDIGSPPFSVRDEQGNATGFEVDILKAIAENQGFSIAFIGQKRADLYQHMSEGRYQVMVASLEINPDNLAKFDMTNPHAKSYRAILSRNDKKASSVDDLLKGDLVGVQENTVSAKLLEEAGANIQTYPNLFANFQDFIQGKNAFIVGNSVPLSYYVKQYNKDQSLHLAPYDNPVKINDIAFGVTKGNTELTEKINAGLSEILANGTYEQIYQKWFENDTIASIKDKP